MSSRFVACCRSRGDRAVLLSLAADRCVRERPPAQPATAAHEEAPMMTHPQRRTPTADGRRKVSVLLTASLVSSLIMLDANIVAVIAAVDGAVARRPFT